MISNIRANQGPNAMIDRLCSTGKGREQRLANLAPFPLVGTAAGYVIMVQYAANLK